MRNHGDALTTLWMPRSYWCNPPYSRCREFVAKAAQERERVGALTVMLLPSRTDTRWFHDHVWQKPGVEIRFIKGRLKFGDGKNSAPFPSMVVVFRP